MEKLSVIYDKRKKDFVAKSNSRIDSNLVLSHLLHDTLRYKAPVKPDDYPHNFDSFNFLKELEGRGYDITTLKFSIDLK